MKLNIWVIKFLIFSFFLVFRVEAQELVSFKVNDQSVVFYDYQDDRITISKNCVKKKKIQPCMAYKALQAASFQTLAEEKFQGGANPGAVICKALKGKVVIGEDKKANENSFCLFEDKSIIDNGSLSYYATQNDNVK